MKKLLFITVFISVTFSLIAQVDTTAVKTPEGICAAMLAFISFEKNEVKDWDDFRNLFLPTAHLMSFRFQPGESLSKQAKNLTLEEFVRYFGPGYPKNGFEEYVIGLEVKEFNGIASVFQSFYCKTLNGSYEARGVNAYQLVYLNNRWWIAHSMFTNETEDSKLPNDLLFEKYQNRSDENK